MSRLLFAVVLCGAALACTAAPADIVFTQGGRPASAAETGAAFDPVPAGSFVHQFFVTTDANTDILSVNQLVFNFDMAIYQHDVGVDNEPPNPLVFPAFPSMSADSYITTPGITAVGVPDDGDPPFTNGSIFFDTTNNGQQTNFLFAQLTLPALASGTFSGRVTVEGPVNTLTDYPFSFTITAVPEASAFLLLGAVMLPVSAVLYVRRRGKQE
jgi:hypothetical protein